MCIEIWRGKSTVWEQQSEKRENKPDGKNLRYYVKELGFPSGSVVKNPSVNTGDAGSICGSRRSPGEGTNNPLLYSCLGNPMNRRAWQATVYEVAESETTWTLNNNKWKDQVLGGDPLQMRSAASQKRHSVFLHSLVANCRAYMLSSVLKQLLKTLKSSLS